MHLSITGGAGFLGRHIVTLAGAAGHRVTVLSRDPQRAADALAAAGAGRAARCVRFDLAEAAAGAAALAGDPPDALIHAAALIKGTPEQLAAANVAGTAALLGALAALPRPPRFVLISSFAVEDIPSTPYSDSKLAAEAIVQRGPLPWVILRPALIYGADDAGNTAALVAKLRAGTMWLPARGRAAIQPVHVDDVAAACLQASSRAGAAGHVYRLGGPEPVSVAAFREAVRAASGGRARIRGVPLPLFGLAARLLALAGRSGPAGVHAFHRRDHVVDSGDAQRDLDFRPRPLAAGLAQTFAPR